MNKDEIITELQECHKISIKEDYDKIQAPLLSLIVKLSYANEELLVNDNTSQLDKGGKDYTRYTIVFLNSSQKKEVNQPKARVPEISLNFLLDNNLLSEEDFKFFSINNFGRTFAAGSGDLILDYEQDPRDTKVQRYTEITSNNKKYYICNQWDKSSIDKFNQHINDKFSKYIKIEEQKRN
jgi:hypothetical protein